MTTKPMCKQALTFLRANHGRRALAPLTSQDAHALDAFVHLVDLCACADAAGREHAVAAMAHAVAAMQPHTQDLCRKAIPAAWDYHMQESLWHQIISHPAFFHR